MNAAKPLLFSMLTSLALTASAWGDIAAGPEGMVILTVGGDVAHPNRGAASEEDATILGKLGVSFDKAVEFDLAGLDALEQGFFEQSYNDGMFAGTFTGPRISAILDAVGLPGSTVYAMALDGYEAEIPGAYIARYEPILATHLNGRPLGLGGFGPTTVVFPEVDDPDETEAINSMLPWATIYLDVE
ncbi:MAG: hypothetical protein NXH97_15785 [Rhodobacteraceae bacterium]|nr:hypothetical protein [Paracoccaceae bacterium]